MKMKMKHALFAGALGLASLNFDDKINYQKRLKEMAKRQLKEHQASESTYKAGVDFKTNQPIFYLKQGQSCLDTRTKDIILSLLPALPTEKDEIYALYTKEAGD